MIIGGSHMKIQCEFDDKMAKCPVVGNKGILDGKITKIVLYKGQERVVQRYGNVFKPKTINIST
jgi:hypothetical protein